MKCLESFKNDVRKLHDEIKLLSNELPTNLTLLNYLKGRCKILGGLQAVCVRAGCLDLDDCYHDEDDCED